MMKELLYNLFPEDEEEAEEKDEEKIDEEEKEDEEIGDINIDGFGEE